MGIQYYGMYGERMTRYSSMLHSLPSYAYGTHATIPSVYQCPIQSPNHFVLWLTLAHTLNIGAEFHHLYLTLTRLPFTVTCSNILSAWHTATWLILFQYEVRGLTITNTAEMDICDACLLRLERLWGR